ncbi:expressed unknown protein [Seminavis robusta]|uniref:SET domain-containing protein n=1 Tax=Seminavis robusta TaxID=568900 RepID=A0A9N8HTM0_9STRA|nr:expressed unknown protein [Seminavis robusta]|eukprot:Sro1904_g304580.1 n/a (623) ;mRNA; f:17089-19092
MGKKQKQQHRSGSSSSGDKNPGQQSSASASSGRGKSTSSQQQQQQQQPPPQNNKNPQQSRQNNVQNKTQQQQHTPLPPQLEEKFHEIEKWMRSEQQGILWVLGCVTLGCLFGFGIGSGWLTGGASFYYSSSSTTMPVSPWRVELGSRIRGSLWYQTLFLQSSSAAQAPPSALLHQKQQTAMYAVLREAVVREKNGFVHPDLGIMIPAPCGAPRGIGMVKDGWHKCQSACNPGVAKEKMDLHRNQQAKLMRANAAASAYDDPDNSTSRVLWLPPIPDHTVYKQEEVLVRVPLTFQMTRQVALDTLLPRIPGDVQRKANPQDLDDAALLVLLLAHERGVGRHSRWFPYIASLPREPTCGYSSLLRQATATPTTHQSQSQQQQQPQNTAAKLLQEELGVDTYGWKGELAKAHKHALRIVHGLTKDYGTHILHPDGMTAMTNLEWALCQVTSRATAGSEAYGSLRMVPLVDMINHDAAAGGFVELTGKERLAHGNFLDATEDSAGTFCVRSVRHGRRKALKKGQELLVNYNVPHYSPLDWFVSLGFVPPERQQQWEKIDAALPRIRQDHDAADADVDTQQQELWDTKYGPELLAQYKEQQKKKRNKHKTTTTEEATTTTTKEQTAS